MSAGCGQRCLGSVLFALMLGGVVPCALGADYTHTRRLVVELEQHIEFNLQRQALSHVENFTLNNYVFPQSISGEQLVLAFQSDHADYATREVQGRQFLSYRYDDKTLKARNHIINRFTIQSDVSASALSHKPVFPLKTLPAQVGDTLRFDQANDINEAMYEQARLLAEGSDDAFVVAVNVADWIQQAMDYDIASLQVPSALPATQAFAQRKGVCQDLTNVFISMMRALHIPARAVYGFAHTGEQALGVRLDLPWGTHAWAEVWLGDRWLPFDLSYQQYGYVDAGHIVIAKEAAIRHVLMQTEGVGLGVELTGSEQSSRIKVVSATPSAPPSRFTLALQTVLDDHYQGELILTVKNTTDHYQARVLQWVKAKDVHWQDAARSMQVFRPYEEKKLRLAFRLPNLNDGFTYTFPFAVRLGGQRLEYELKVTPGISG